MRVAVALILALLFGGAAEAQTIVRADQFVFGLTGTPSTLKRIMTGAGSPEGVVTAVVNTLYFETGSSLIWQKATGTGNTGWVNALTGVAPAAVAPGAAGTFMRSTGATWGASTLVLPNAATANRLAYATATNTIGESANLTFNGTDFAVNVDDLFVQGSTGNVGISTASPSALFSVGAGSLFQVSSTGVVTTTGAGTHSLTANTTGVNALLIRNSNGGTGASANLYFGNDATATAAEFGITSSAYVTSGIFAPNVMLLTSLVGGGISLAARDTGSDVRIYAEDFISFSDYNSNTPLERMRIDGAGNVGIGTTAPGQKLDVNGAIALGGNSGSANNLAWSGAAPTISSGFGSSPSVTAGTSASFRVNVGTGGTASSGVVAMPTAANGWNCHVQNLTGQAANRADQRTVQTASATTTITVQNQTISTGAALAWAASDILTFLCTAY